MFPERSLTKSKLDVKWKSRFIPDMNIGFQPSLQRLRNEAVSFWNEDPRNQASCDGVSADHPGTSVQT